jgi:pimeloyl-ACP methyl ester carboxylesterase
VLEWLEYGDPDGLPVVVHPGTPATARSGALADAAAQRAGVRLIAVSRPGYGSSATTPPGLASVAEQVASLADQLGLPSFGVWSWSGGGPYALAQAAVTPERVRRVVVAAGPSEGWPAEAESALSDEAIELGSAFAQMDDETMTSALAEQAPDSEDYFDQHPEERPTFLADFRHALARPDGYVRDNLSWEGDWDISLTNVHVPIDLVYGDADLMVTLEDGMRLAEKLPHARLHVLAGAGHGATTFGAADFVLGLFTTPL